MQSGARSNELAALADVMITAYGFDCDGGALGETCGSVVGNEASECLCWALYYCGWTMRRSIWRPCWKSARPMWQVDVRGLVNRWTTNEGKPPHHVDHPLSIGCYFVSRGQGARR